MRKCYKKVIKTTCAKHFCVYIRIIHSVWEIPKSLEHLNRTQKGLDIMASRKISNVLSTFAEIQGKNANVFVFVLFCIGSLLTHVI